MPYASFYQFGGVSSPLAWHDSVGLSAFPTGQAGETADGRWVASHTSSMITHTQTLFRAGAWSWTHLQSMSPLPGTDGRLKPVAAEHNAVRNFHDTQSALGQPTKTRSLSWERFGGLSNESKTCRVLFHRFLRVLVVVFPCRTAWPSHRHPWRQLVSAQSRREGKREEGSVEKGGSFIMSLHLQGNGTWYGERARILDT